MIMKMCVPTMLLALMLAPVAAGAASVEEQLNQLEEQRHQALVSGNWHDLAALHGDEFFYNSATGTSLTKKAFIGYMKSGAVRVKRATREPAAVRVHGNTAVVTGVERVEATVEGKDKTVSSRYLHVWANEAQGWRLVARQATYLTENR
ncbi:MAG: nuclear transport factor 2 family protein [Rhodocyclaceae bacterium]|jgi:ketosteroid isomerase-like protein|nr:nuclear transport factor 2 family protein [Rhodocyclaceae bacterium]MBK6676036.1 nuclear transport factor 2 family protein [Rhodocyclaceae bacterium]MBK9311340.1 nuclear transport factor 2 family protein [Rhodocyclaceae bacterium]